MPPSPRPKNYSEKAPVTVYLITPRATGKVERKRVMEVDLESRTMKVDCPLVGEMFGRRKALSYIRQTLKSSSERALLIQFMVEWRFVPSSTALYDLVRNFENSSWLPDDDWKKQGRPKNTLEKSRPARDPEYEDRSDYFSARERQVDIIGSRFTGKKYHKPHLGGRWGWQGIINLYVTPVTFKQECSIDPSMLSSPEKTNICLFLGDRLEGSLRRDTSYCKLYFNPKWFPPPLKMNEKGERVWDEMVSPSDTFDLIRSYIKWQAKASGSPVTCNGGGKHFKQFVCGHCHRKRENTSESFQRCPFAFQLRWDTGGWFIHLREHGGWFMTAGSGLHCCPMKEGDRINRTVRNLDEIDCMNFIMGSNQKETGA